MNFNMDDSPADRWDIEQMESRAAAERFISLRGDNEGDVDSVVDGTECILYKGTNRVDKVQRLVARTLYLIDIHLFEYEGVIDEEEELTGE